MYLCFLTIPSEGSLQHSTRGDVLPQWEVTFQFAQSQSGHSPNSWGVTALWVELALVGHATRLADFFFPDSVTDKEQLSCLIKKLLLQHRETIPGSHSKASERNDCGVSSPRWHISQPTPAPEAQRTQRKQAREESDSQRTREMAVSSCPLVRTGKLYWWNLNSWLPKQDQKDLNNSRHPSIVGGELRGLHTSMKSSKQSATAERGRIAFPREEYLVGQSVLRGQS